MRSERSNVEFPLWRKKVDKSLFEHDGTTIPTWACEMWELPGLFYDVYSKRDERSQVKVRHERRTYDGWVTTAKHGRKTPAVRLWYEQELTMKLKRAFLMSYMRSLEQKLRPEKKTDIEEEIPFWEFLDIEFDKDQREFRFVAYFRQEPTFPGLFDRLIESPGLKKIADELEGKKEARIHKQYWKPRDQLQFEIGATNVLYVLADTGHKLLYVGEAGELVERLSAAHPSIPDWDLFRYDVLPEKLAPFRVELERMLIRGFAKLLPNKKHLENIRISDFGLANDKIDK